MSQCHLMDSITKKILNKSVKFNINHARVTLQWPEEVAFL